MRYTTAPFVLLALLGAENVNAASLRQLTQNNGNDQQYNNILAQTTVEDGEEESEVVPPGEPTNEEVATEAENKPEDQAEAEAESEGDENEEDVSNALEDQGSNSSRVASSVDDKFKFENVKPENDQTVQPPKEETKEGEVKEEEKADETLDTTAENKDGSKCYKCHKCHKCHGCKPNCNKHISCPRPRCPHRRCFVRPCKKTLHQCLREVKPHLLCDYGHDKQGVLEFQNTGANAHQGRDAVAIPDVCKRTVGAHNSNTKHTAYDKETWSGTRKKKFCIRGCIQIAETQCGGLCKKNNGKTNKCGCTNAESLQSIADKCAKAPKICCCSAHCCKKRCHRCRCNSTCK